MGWGVRSMIDIPAGVFLCTYAGAILTDSQAEREGKAASFFLFRFFCFLYSVSGTLSIFRYLEVHDRDDR